MDHVWPHTYFHQLSSNGIYTLLVWCWWCVENSSLLGFVPATSNNAAAAAEAAKTNAGNSAYYGDDREDCPEPNSTEGGRVKLDKSLSTSFDNLLVVPPIVQVLALIVPITKFVIVTI